MKGRNTMHSNDDTFEQMPEAKAASIVWRLLSKLGQTNGMTWTEFELSLKQGNMRMDGAKRQAVIEIADAMRQYAAQEVEIADERFRADLEIMETLAAGSEWAAVAEAERLYHNLGERP
jgi:hypothetical protein